MGKDAFSTDQFKIADMAAILDFSHPSFSGFNYNLLIELTGHVRYYFDVLHDNCEEDFI